MSRGFEPCPICGRALSEKDIEFYDDGSYIGDMEMVHDFENVMDPSNSVCEDDWKKLDESDRRQIGNNYIEAAEAVEEFMVVCPCGFRFVVDRWTTRYPEKGWLDEVMEKTNRRFGRTEDAERFRCVPVPPPLHGGLHRTQFLRPAPAEVPGRGGADAQTDDRYVLPR